MPEPPADTGPDSAWERARKRLERKRKFWGDLVAYVVINLLLTGIWLVSGRGYFWPAWVMGIWGVFLLLDGWNVFLRRPITEEDIQEELRRGGATPSGSGR
jgi:hypothetical protein